VSECDREASTMRRPGPLGAVASREKKNIWMVAWYEVCDLCFAGILQWTQLKKSSLNNTISPLLTT